jgi:O-antigen/teichoic acid export membrane protein
MLKPSFEESIELEASTCVSEAALCEGPGPGPALVPGVFSLQSLTRQSAVNMAGGIISQALKFFVVIYVARKFSVPEFSLFSFAVAVNAYMFIVSNFGLPVFASRAVAKSGSVSRELMTEICGTRMCLALFTVTLAIGFLLLAPGVNRREITLVAVFGLSNVAQSGLLDWVFQGLQRLEVSAVLNVLCQGGWLSLAIVGVRLGFGLLAVPAALVASVVFASVVGYLWLGRFRRSWPSWGDRSRLFRRSWQILKRVAPLGWGSILLTVLVWTDTMWVRFLRGGSAVGIYAAGNRAGLAISMLGAYYVQGAFPLLSRVSEQDGSMFQHCLERVCSDLALIFIPGAIFSIAYAKEIIALVFPKPEYLAAVPVFCIFQVAMLLFIMNNLLGTGVLVAHHQDHAFRRILGGTTALFLILSPVLTWQWGLRGAATAVLTLQAVSLLWFSMKTRKLTHLSPTRVLLVPCLAGVAAAALGRWLRLPLQFAIPELGLCYLALLFWRVYGLHPKELKSLG